MGWVYSASVKGVDYYRGKPFVFWSHTPLYISCDATSQNSSIAPNNTVWFYGKFEADYSRHEYCISRQNNGSPSGYVDYNEFEPKISFIYFNANGGSNPPPTQRKVWGQTPTLDTRQPTRTGYSFIGWSTTPNGASQYYGGGKWGADYDVTLYAVWMRNTYTFLLNANGGTVSPNNKNYGYNDIVSGLPTPNRTGWTFKGWTFTKDGTDFINQRTYRAVANKTLYAKWQINTYTLTINPNGGTYNGSTAVNTSKRNYGVSVTVTRPKRTGYNFAGWSKAGQGTFSGTIATIGLGAMTLTAMWTINEYQVIFDATANGGEGTTAVGKDYNETLGVLPTATKQYYRFLGWYTAKTGGTLVQASYKVTASVTFYAQYELVTTVSVNVKGKWKAGVPYVLLDGQWMQGYCNVYTEDKWNQGYGIGEDTY